MRSNSAMCLSVSTKQRFAELSLAKCGEIANTGGSPGFNINGEWYHYVDGSG